jgi:hypothetical protein
MGLLAAIEDSPSFTTAVPLSAADLEILRQNILALDGATYLPAPPFERIFGQSLEDFGRNPSPFWHGAFRFLSGMTTLYCYVNSSGLTTGDKLRITLTGDTVTSTADTTLTAGAQTITTTISALGFADGEVVRLDLYLYNASRGTSSIAWGTTRLDMIVLAPVAVSDSYPGVPTFGAISAANLNQLSNAVDWCVRTVGLHHRPLFQAVVREQGPFGPRPDGRGGLTWVHWVGGVRRTNEHAVLTVDAQMLVLDGQYAEKVELFVDGTLRATYTVPSTAGEYDFTLSYTIATTVDAISRVEVLYTRTGLEATAAVIYNRLTIWRVSMDRATDPTALVIAEKPARVSGTFTALQTWLNSLCTAVTAIKARIDANPDVWARQYPFKKRNGLPINDQQVFYAPSRISWSPGRIGEALIVRGKALTLSYGPLILPDQPDSNEAIPRHYTVKYVLNENIADGDAIETHVHYLDSFAALAPGAAFAVLGVETHYAAERLLVTAEGV